MRKRSTLIIFSSGIARVAIGAIQAIILIPLYIKFLGEDLYGSWVAIGEIMLWLLMFDMGITNFITQRISSLFANGRYSDMSGYFWAGLIIMISISFCLSGLIFYLSEFVTAVLDVDDPFRGDIQNALIHGGIAVSINLVSNVFVGVSRAILKSGVMAIGIMMSGLLSIVVNIIMLYHGYGIYSIIGGMYARAATLAVASLVFWISECRWTLGNVSELGKRASEILRAMPATGLGGLGFALTYQAELFLITISHGGEMALRYMILRKGADLVLSVTNNISYSIYGSYSNLVASNQAESKFSFVYICRDICLGLSVILLSSYIMLNNQFTLIWTGIEIDNAETLTLLIALQFSLAGWSLMLNTLYKSGGDVVRGSYVQAIEAIFRIVMLGGFLFVMQLDTWSVPASGIAVAIFGICINISYISIMNIFTDADILVEIKRIIPFMLIIIAAGYISYSMKIQISGWILLLIHGAIYSAIFYAVLFALIPSFRKTSSIIIDSVFSSNGFSI